MNRCLLIGFATLLLISPETAPAAATGTIEQHFPADEPASKARTTWRVVWGIEAHAGGSEVLFIKEAYFTRAPGEPEIKVLGDCRIAEIFVPYNYGWRVYDVAAFTFPLVELDQKDLGPACLGSGVLYGKDGKPGPGGFVARELHDDHVRWMDQNEQTYRGQMVQVWSVMKANNYRYVILYAFRDDGVINVRLGATANNRYSTQSDWATHIHSGFWRINVDLGDPFANAVAVIRYSRRDSLTTVEPIVTEKRLKWNPEEYTRLRVTSTRFQNGHTPANYIGYDVVLHTEGSGRHNLEGEDFTHNDFWITRLALSTSARGISPATSGVRCLRRTARSSGSRPRSCTPPGTKTLAGTATTAWAVSRSPPGTDSISSPGTSFPAPRCTTERRTDPAELPCPVCGEAGA